MRRWKSTSALSVWAAGTLAPARTISAVNKAYSSHRNRCYLRRR